MKRNGRRKEKETMVAEFEGVKVIIPKGFGRMDEDGFFMDGHGVQYALVSYGWGWGEDLTICLETIYSKHTRTIVLDRV